MKLRMRKWKVKARKKAEKNARKRYFEEQKRNKRWKSTTPKDKVKKIQNTSGVVTKSFQYLPK